MRTRLLLTGALAASFVGAASAPASASCYPQKPQTCQTCHVTGIYFDENGIPRLAYECPWP